MSSCIPLKFVQSDYVIGVQIDPRKVAYSFEKGRLKFVSTAERSLSVWEVLDAALAGGRAESGKRAVFRVVAFPRPVERTQRMQTLGKE
jgi:hypothetical protein